MCSLESVFCSFQYSVHCAVNTVQCTVCNVQNAALSMKFAMCIVHCGVQCAECRVQFVVGMQCAV